MTPATSRRLARALAALSLVFLASGDVLSATSGGVIRFGADVLIAAIAIVFSIVGVLIASRQPGNAIGWVFLAAGLATGVAGLAGGYAEYWLDSGNGSDALGQTAAWYATLSWVPFVLVPPTFLLLLFPDGRLLSRRWRPVAWCAAVGIAGTFLTTGLRPGPLEDFPELANPYAVTSPLLDPLAVVAALLVVIGLFGSAASLILRFHRAQGRERQQIKWLALAGAVAAATVPIAAGGSGLWGSDVQNIAIMLSVLGLPIAAGIAILRHRLYDIDVVINRTLVYGALTATLAGAYFVTVLVLQLALSGVTAESDLAIAGSTLAVAALFRPARRRIQALVDRRFYRRRYDAARTLEGFGARLREQVELDALRAELCGAVAETVQPAHVSLWLREDVGR